MARNAKQVRNSTCKVKVFKRVLLFHIQIEISMVAAWPFFMCILYAATASPNTQYSSVSDECLANENEVRACGSECQTTCATSNQVCPIVNVKCNDACYCVEGYARDQNGRCIPDTSYECERLKPGIR